MHMSYRLNSLAQARKICEGEHTCFQIDTFVCSMLLQALSRHNVFPIHARWHITRMSSLSKQVVCMMESCVVLAGIEIVAIYAGRVPSLRPVLPWQAVDMMASNAELASSRKVAKLQPYVL